MSSWRTAPRFQTMFFILAVLLLNPFLASAQTIVAIIDTGVNELHPDLTGQVTGGFDFVDNDGLADDRVGHGTELAGVVAANGAIQGVCITCQVMPLKVTDHTLADQDLIAQAITYAVANGAQVVLIGVGAIGNYSAVATAIATAEAAGIVVIAPAGSEELAHTLYPAALPTVVSVVGVDSSGVFLRMSNTSGRETVAAIGKNVETTGLLGFSVPRTGSSIAAAFVAGIAGRLLGAEPGLTPVQVRQILKHGVDPVPIPRWYDYFDYGIANIDSALARASATFKDVAVKRLSVFPNSPLTGQSHFVRVEISNMGNVTSDSVFLDVTHNGLPVGSTVELAPLDAGETVLADVNLPTVFAPSTVDVSATVQTQAAENRTANNTLLVSVVYTGVAVHDVDMIVGEISEPVIEAANIHVPIKLRNRGNQGETVTVTAYMDDIPFSTQIFALAVGDTQSFVETWPIAPLQAERFRELRVAAAISGDADPDNNEWTFDLSIGERGWPAHLQYSDTAGRTDIVIDAPWRTIRSYLPVLLYTPQFPGSRRLEWIKLSGYDPSTNTVGSEIFHDDRDDSDNIPSGTVFIDPDGNTRGAMNTGDDFDSFWHYIIRLPVSSIGSNGTHYLWTKVKWTKKVLWLVRRNHYWRRVLRVQIQSQDLPRFDPNDRYFDAHIHTIAEQTHQTRFSRNAPVKNYGGPIAMVLESAYALGMTNTQLSGGNWTDFKEEVIVTDHNVFYSTDPYDKPAAPHFGPTKNTDGHQGERDWYRNNLGELAGEELCLKRGSNQTSKLSRFGHHFLAYATKHFEGPWHGGKFGGADLDNPNTMQDVLTEMKSHNDVGFGYAAHPLLASLEWPPEYFCQAIGYSEGGDCGEDNNCLGGIHVNSSGTDFQFKGSQVWNTKCDEASKNNGDLNDENFDNMNPFRQDKSTEQQFQPNWAWLALLNISLTQYEEQVQAGLIYNFKDCSSSPDPSVQKRKLIRKVYMSAGTDAHGDFNYLDDIESTFTATISDVGSMSSNAFGRVRTYALVHDRPWEGSLDATAKEAYREGNTVLTDGPVCMFALDGNGRADTPQGDVPVWHDAQNQYENADGRIGGAGTFDGGRTLLVPRRHSVAGSNVYIQTEWRKSATTGASSIEQLLITEIRPGGLGGTSVPAGAMDTPRTQAYPNDITVTTAIMMEGNAVHSDVSKDERCITNPVWAVPVTIEVETPNLCPILPGSLIVRFHFPLSMGGQLFEIPEVYVQPLDSLGISGEFIPYVLDNVSLQPAPGWQEENGVYNGVYVASNLDSIIPCPLALWDADTHQPSLTKVSCVVWMNDPIDLYGNQLNDIGCTFTIGPSTEIIPTASSIALIIVAAMMLISGGILIGIRRHRTVGIHMTTLGK